MYMYEKSPFYLPSIFSTLDDELALYSGDDVFFSPFDERTVMVRFILSVRRSLSPISAYSTVIKVMGNTKNSSVDSVNDTVDSSILLSISRMERMLHWSTPGNSLHVATVNCNACGNVWK